MNAHDSRFEAGIKRDQLLALHDYAARFFRTQTASSWVPSYLAGRGIDLNVQRRWHVGYAPAGWDTLTHHLRTVGFKDSLIVAGGLARQSQRGVLTDTFRDRAVIPIRSPDGTIIAFIGRAAEHARPDTPKYVNSPATAIYSKGDLLFGLPGARPALDDGAVPVIAEGPLDVMAIAMADRHRYTPVAPCGTALTSRQVNALNQACDLRSTGVLVAFDSDDAGRRAAINAYHLLSLVTDRIAMVNLPAGSDPAQILRDHGPVALAELLTRSRLPLADLVIDAEIDKWSRWLSFAEGQIGALRAIAPVIAAMPPRDVARQVARLAHRLSLDHATVTEAVTDALTQLISGEHTHRSRAATRPCTLDFPDGAQHLTAAAVPKAVPAPEARPRAAGADRPGLGAGRVRR
jgi:DNA primase